MSQKIKRKFIIAAKEPGWFRAVSENELARAGKKPEDALYFDQPLEGASLLSSYDKYNLLHIGVGTSAGVKADLTAALASEIIKRPGDLAPVLTGVINAETDYRSIHIDYKLVDKILDEKGEEEGLKLTQDPVFLKSLPVENFGRPEFLAQMVNFRDAAETIDGVLKDDTKQAPEKLQAVTAALGKLDAEGVIRFADSYGFYYGDGFNEWDGPTRSEVKAYFNVAKSLMQHWDEAGKSPSGKPYDAISAGKEGRRVVFLTEGLVEKKKAAAPKPAAPAA